MSSASSAIIVIDLYEKNNLKNLILLPNSDIYSYSLQNIWEKKLYLYPPISK